MGNVIVSFLESTGFAALSWQAAAMILVGCVLIYLGIARRYEPLLLVPIGFGAVLVNIPLAGMFGPEGLLRYFYFGIETGVFPPLIFLGVGAMTDFGPLLARPRTFLLGAAAQFGIFATLIGARALGFDFAEAASISIIGGADGPTAIYLTSQLAPDLLGPVAVAAYSYMALVPIIQPPIIRLLTSRKERAVVMGEVRQVSRRVRIVFPIVTTIVAALFVPAATPLIGMLMLGNLFREAGVVERLSRTAQNELVNIVTILLALSVGSKMSAEEFLTVQTILIIVLGLVAFCIGTTAGVLLGKLMYVLSRGKVNPMIGAAGVSAVPMAARVVQKVGQEENPSNFLLMNAMGPNVAGVIGSAIAAGILLSLV
jgi:oxaloacetate decarboxylase beta subunit